MSFLPLPPASHLLEINIGFICGKGAIGKAASGREKPSGALWASQLVFVCGSNALPTRCLLSTASTAFVPRLFTRPLFSLSCLLGITAPVPCMWSSPEALKAILSSSFPPLLLAVPGRSPRRWQQGRARLHPHQTGASRQAWPCLGLPTSGSHWPRGWWIPGEGGVGFASRGGVGLGESLAGLSLWVTARAPLQGRSQPSKMGFCSAIPAGGAARSQTFSVFFLYLMRGRVSPAHVSMPGGSRQRKRGSQCRGIGAAVFPLLIYPAPYAFPHFV